MSEGSLVNDGKWCVLIREIILSLKLKYIPSACRRTSSTWDVRRRTDPAMLRRTKRKASVLLDKVRGSISWKHSSGSPGHHHEGHLIIYRDINLYFTHIHRGQKERKKEAEEAGGN